MSNFASNMSTVRLCSSWLCHPDSWYIVKDGMQTYLYFVKIETLTKYNRRDNEFER